MSDQKGIKSMIDRNPHAARDRKTLEEALEVVRELRKMGRKPKGYDLVSPFERRRGQESARIVVSISNRPTTGQVVR